MAYKKSNPNGQATMANSEPVVLASDHSDVKVTLDGETVTVGSSALPTGASTAANQATIIGHVDGIETLLGTIDADTSALVTSNAAIQTAVQTLDNAIAGSEMQVDVVTSALPTGAATSANQTTIIGHVDGIESTLTTIEGDTSAIQTAVQLIDDTIFADDAAVTLGTSKGGLIAGVAVTMDGTDPTAISAEGDATALRSDPNRILLVNQTHPRFFRASADYASAQTNASVVAAPGASLSLWITDIIISNGATAGNITLLDGSGGSVVLEVYPGVNGGLTHSFRNPIKLTANTALCITSTTVTTHSVTVTGHIAA